MSTNYYYNKHHIGKYSGTKPDPTLYLSYELLNEIEIQTECGDTITLKELFDKAEGAEVIFVKGGFC